MKMTSKMKMNPKMILENTNCYGPKIEDTIKKVHFTEKLSQK